VESARTWPFPCVSRMKPIAQFGALQLTKYGHLTRGRQDELHRRSTVLQA
jgi:hypothetical protein